ncbi:MAG: MBOAT family O-acyltransferase [Halioglobus sp.]
MLFNSAEYLFLFLPLALVVYLFLARRGGKETQFLWLVLVSMFFYAVWEPVYLALILGSITANFIFGKKLAYARGRSRHWWLVLGLTFNLGLLAYFKYTGFFVETLNHFWLWLIPLPEITLPLAISFFTFQQIAYLVDVSRGECEEYEFRHYALFVLFFPQLIAGPIVHHKEMMPQFLQPRQRQQYSADFAVGITFIAIGLFKKVVIADSLALIVDPVFAAADQGETLNSIDALLGMFAFSFQIYFDFSGYSDIAIGSARLFGIKLPENFRSPYKSRSIIEIWRRWHMTLSKFLRDYLYFSFGGNRFGLARRYRNLMLTMLLGGLWHGAAWTFVIWGGLHGLYLCINHAWRALLDRVGLRQFFAGPGFQPAYLVLTFLVWSIAFVVFRAPDVAAAWAILEPALLELSLETPRLLEEVFTDKTLGKLISFTDMATVAYFPIYFVMAMAAAICWLLPNTQQFLLQQSPLIIPEGDPIKPGWLVWKPGLAMAGIIAFMLVISLLSLSSLSRFIYFQF